MPAQPSLSNIQLELLKLYSFNIPDADLLNIKQYLAKYFAAKAIDEADRIWEQRNYYNETMDKWLNEDNTDDKSRH